MIQTSRAVAGGPDHSASGQETGHWTAGVLASGWSWSYSVDAQVGAQRRVNLVAGPPSGLSRGLGTRRFEKSPRVVQADVRGSRPFVGVAPNPTIYRGEHGRVVRVVVHRCGLLGCRVGEASNPGPVQTRQARRLERSNPTGSRGVRNTQVEVSSDEETLVRPNNGCRSRRLVLTSGTVGESQNTIPASPRALIAAGLAKFDNEQSRDTIPREVDDCSSAGSESCWGEMEDIADDEVPEWGVLPPPPDSNRFALLADAEIVLVGPTVPDRMLFSMI